MLFEADARSSTSSTGRESNEKGPSRRPKGAADSIPYRLLTPMPVIIDGNNLLHSLPSGEQNRDSVRRRALDTVRHGGMMLAPGGPRIKHQNYPDPEHLGRLTIRYSGASSADDLILRLLPKSGRASEWVVITDDRALRGRVSEQGAQVRTLREWQSRRPRKPRRISREPKLSSREVADWEIFFSSREDDDD